MPIDKTNKNFDAFPTRLEEDDFLNANETVECKPIPQIIEKRKISSETSIPNSKTPIIEIITKLLDNHVALATSNWFIIYPNDQRQIGFLNGDTTSALKEIFF